MKPRISGAHSIIYSKNAQADRDFLRDVLQFPHVDVGRGWLIFALPPAEVAVHPADDADDDNDDDDERHELYLMVDDVAEFVTAMAARGVTCTPPNDQRWGILTQLTLPSGAKLGVYQPRHERPVNL